MLSEFLLKKKVYEFKKNEFKFIMINNRLLQQDLVACSVVSFPVADLPLDSRFSVKIMVL